MELESTLLELLHFRNASLLRFCEITRDHLASTTETPTEGEAEAIQGLLERRESLLQAIRLGEKKIEEISQALLKSGAVLSAGTLEKMRLKETDRETLLSVASRLHAELSRSIESQKNRTLETLSTSRKLQGALAKYKSEWASRQNSGEGLDELR